MRLNRFWFSRDRWGVEGKHNLLNARAREGTCFLLMGIVALACWLIASMSVAAERRSPTEAVRETIKEIMNILADKQLQRPDKVAERRELVRKAASRLMDYEEMGKRTLGAYWGKLDSAQRQEFLRLFKPFLSKSYETHFDEYDDQTVRYEEERIIENFAQVRTILVSHGTEIPMEFRLLWKGGQWRVYDVVVDGISIVKNYRAQFARILHQSSFEELLGKLKAKVDGVTKLRMAHE